VTQGFVLLRSPEAIPPKRKAPGQAGGIRLGTRSRTRSQLVPDAGPDLIGRPVLQAGETLWADETLTKALLCSKERPTMVVIDEANRAPARAKSSLFQALDWRCEAVLGGRGGEVIEGTPLDLVTLATINVGPGYQTEPIDKAEKRRYGNRWSVGFLGMSQKEDPSTQRGSC